ncbi:MAG: molybdopterin-guanine dinucleotide biosynthesis protein B [Candidatus Caldarchaeum sp.]|nr:molybdopterin-guanine dinucleotide biosynthesis protein B [Candidatus Caldarchaeum sp.]
MKHLAIMGTKNSGKTFVATRLIERFSREGYRVAALKHIHHQFTIDTEGKDTWKMARSGAMIVASVSPNETAVLFCSHERWEDRLSKITRIMAEDGVELVVYEGFHNTIGKSSEVYKILTVKQASDLEILKDVEQPLVAVFRRENMGLPPVGLPVFGPDFSEEFYQYVKKVIGMKQW